MKKLTIGSAVYDDFDGVYFSYQSIRLNNQDIWDDLDLIIIDNNPDSAQGKATKSFCEKTKHVRYIPYTEKTSTTVRNEIFKNAEGEFCMSIDCHVLFEPNTIKRLIKYFEDNPDTKDLFHGPMFYDVINGHDPCTHMDPVWRDNMFGIWGYDKRGNHADNPPFEIPMHGLGIFACKTSEWLGFNKNFVGFGGEEGYIHKKYEQAGRKTWCLPFLRWLHRFDRPNGVQYPLAIQDRIKNYLIGYKELNLPLEEVIKHFQETHPSINIQNLIQECENPNPKPKPQPNPPANIQKPDLSSHNPNIRKIKPDLSQIKLWSQSEVNFSNNSFCRYVKYEILNSYAGLSCLSKVSFFPKAPHAKIMHCNSEDKDHPASNLLENNGYWQSNIAEENKYPHIIIIDLQENIQMDSIVTFSVSGMVKWIPSIMNIYASKDAKKWEKISEINLYEED